MNKPTKLASPLSSLCSSRKHGHQNLLTILKQMGMTTRGSTTTSIQA